MTETMTIQDKILLGVLIVICIIMVIAFGPGNALVIVLFGAAIVASVIGLLLMLAKSQEVDEEKRKYTAEVEEAKAIAHMGEHNPDILLPGFEYCTVDAWHNKTTYEKHYFSVENNKVVTDDRIGPEGDNWTRISYWGDQESSCFLYYRQTNAPHGKKKSHAG